MSFKLQVAEGHALLSDAEENLRAWKLGCVQAEAELRALQCQHVAAGSGLTAATGDTGDQDQINSAALGTAAHASREDADSGIRTTLASILALEKHTSELEEWCEQVEQEAATAQANASALEQRVDLQRACADQRGAEAAAISGSAAALFQASRKNEMQHDAECGALRKEIDSKLEAGSMRPALMSELGDVTSSIAELHPAVQQLADAAHRMHEERDSLLAHQQETRELQKRYISAQSQSNVDIASSRQQLQARGAQLSRLQGDVTRNKAKGDRKRRQLASELAQCQTELGDATARANSAGEALQKLRQRQGQELRKLRQATGGLQEEVEERLRGIENAERELEELQMHENQMDEARQLHDGREMQLEEEAAMLRQHAQNLESRVCTAEAGKQAVQDRLRLAESQREAMKDRLARTKSEVDTHNRRVVDASAALVKLTSEWSDVHFECREQSKEVVELREVGEAVQAMRAKRSALLDERAQLHADVKKSQLSFERFMADMRETARRVSRLKGCHDDLVEVLPTNARGREAAPGAIEQALRKASSRVDAVIAFMENKEAGQKRFANPEMLATSRRSQVALQQRLLQDTERGMNTSIDSAKKAVIAEQQRMLSEVSRRVSEVQTSRTECKQLEKQLASCRGELELLRMTTSQEVQGLEEQLILVNREASDGAQEVTAEFSDLLQKQALERDCFQRQIEQLKHSLKSNNDWGKTSGSKRSSGSMEDKSVTDEDAPLTARSLLERLAQADVEAEALRADEEELLNWQIKLKAVLKRPDPPGSRVGEVSPPSVQRQEVHIGVDKPTCSKATGSQEPPVERVFRSNSQKVTLRGDGCGGRRLENFREGGARMASSATDRAPSAPRADRSLENSISGPSAVSIAAAAPETEQQPEPSRMLNLSESEHRNVRQHLRTLSALTADSTPGSSVNFAMTWPTGPARSASTHSLSPMGSARAGHASRALAVSPSTPRSPTSSQRPPSPMSPPHSSRRVMVSSVSTPVLRTVGLPMHVACGSARAVLPGESAEVLRIAALAPLSTVSYDNASTWPSRSAVTVPVLPALGTVSFG